MTKDRRLGRGLAALLGDTTQTSDGHDEPSETPILEVVPDASEPSHSTIDASFTEVEGERGVHTALLNIHEIDNNPFQPRRDFTEPEIVALSESLKEHKMLQPIVVRPMNGRYQLISGERRLRAAIYAGWSDVPAQIREVNDRLVAELAIVENLQRQDLNPIEKALSFQRYIKEHKCTQDDLARRIKIDRSTIANLMRLIELPVTVQDALRQGNISAGHARALLPLGEEEQQISFCERIQRETISVRETEHQVQEMIRAEDQDQLSVTSNETTPHPARILNHQIESLQQEFRMALGTRIEIKKNNRGRGRIVVHFSNNEEFERIRVQLTDRGTGIGETG